ncbi:hypothetical protein KSP40_PGU013482 [Platanthera guangdongensis]|uniref:Uncharacterized protein n=1 Tax=Platanthera guangdongensis TaxID=2320717 RepID=A0ABR2LQZ1_9ASPA
MEASRLSHFLEFSLLIFHYESLPIGASRCSSSLIQSCTLLHASSVSKIQKTRIPDLGFSRFQVSPLQVYKTHAASVKINSIENCTPDTLSPYLDDIISKLLMLLQEPEVEICATMLDSLNDYMEPKCSRLKEDLAQRRRERLRLIVERGTIGQDRRARPARKRLRPDQAPISKSSRLRALYDTDRATGSHAATATEMSREVDAESMEEKPANTQEHTRVEGKGRSRRRRKRAVGVDAVAVAIEKLADSVEKAAGTKSSTNVDDIYVTLTKMTDLYQHDFLKATDILCHDSVNVIYS